MFSLTVYKQSLTNSCLAACFLMLLQAQKGISFSEAEEQDLALRGSKRKYPFYVVGIPTEVALTYNTRIKIFVDNKFFTDVLQKAFAEQKNITVVHEPITEDLIRKEVTKKPVICHIDTNALGDYSHASHFIILEKMTENMVSIIDPWTGEGKRISNKTLEQAIYDLKTQVKMCPLLLTLEA